MDSIHDVSSKKKGHDGTESKWVGNIGYPPFVTEAGEVLEPTASRQARPW